MAARGVGMVATGAALAVAGIAGAEAGLVLSLILVPIGAVVALVGLYRLLSGRGRGRDSAAQRPASAFLVVGLGAVLAGVAMAVLAGISAGWVVVCAGLVAGVLGAIARAGGAGQGGSAWAGRPGDDDGDDASPSGGTTYYGSSPASSDDDRRRDAAVSWSSVTESASHGGDSSSSSDSGGSSSSDSGSSGSSTD